MRKLAIFSHELAGPGGEILGRLVVPFVAAEWEQGETQQLQLPPRRFVRGEHLFDATRFLFFQSVQ